MIVFASRYYGGYVVDREFELCRRKANLRFLMEADWHIQKPIPIQQLLDFLQKTGYEINLLSSNSRTATFVVSRDGRVVQIECDRLRVSAKAYSKRLEEGKDLKDSFSQFLFPFMERQDSTLVPVEFWHCLDKSTPTFMIRPVPCPTLEDISKNYAPETLKGIQWLEDIQNPHLQGKVVLWYGKTGTGKTFALRSLLRKWSRECRVCNVVDLEAFLNNPEYMYHLLSLSASDLEDDSGSDSGSPLKKGKLIIISEDVPDFILKESRADRSYGMARLLNLTDGLMGQGFECLFFFTTNEEFQEIDPAFTRPGRCLQMLEFKPLPPSSSTEWLCQQGVPLNGGVKEEKTIAELYAILRGQRPLNPSSEAIGFRGSHP